MKFRTVRLSLDEEINTSYGTSIPITPSGTIQLGDRSFSGILSSLTIRLSGVNTDTRGIICRLTEDEQGDLCSMPDAACGLTRGVTTNTKTTTVFKYEVQFSDEYPIHLFVKTDNGSATVDEVILQYRTYK